MALILDREINNEIATKNQKKKHNNISQATKKKNLLAWDKKYYCTHFKNSFRASPSALHKPHRPPFHAHDKRLFYKQWFSDCGTTWFSLNIYN